MKTKNKKTENSILVFYCNVGHLPKDKIKKYIKAVSKRVISPITKKYKHIEGIIIPTRNEESRIEILNF